MITAKEINDKLRSEWEKTFDFKAFDKYIENYFVIEKRNNLYIGLHSRGYMKNFKYPGKCADLKFQRGDDNYVWHSSIQISHEVQRFVEDYLLKNGFHIICKGACGYDKMDVIVVSI